MAKGTRICRFIHGTLGRLNSLTVSEPVQKLYKNFTDIGWGATMNK